MSFAIHVFSLGLAAYIVSAAALTAPASAARYLTALSVLAVVVGFVSVLYRKGHSHLALPLFVVSAAAVGYVVDVNARAVVRGAEISLFAVLAEFVIASAILALGVWWVWRRSSAHA